MNEWIDITRVLRDGMTGWPGDPPFRLRKVADLAGDGVMVSEICTSAHIGTHVDAPLHCLTGGADVAGLALDRLCGPAVVVEADGSELGVEDLERAAVSRGDRVLVRTGGRALTPEVAEWLVARGVVLLGIDSASPDAPQSEHLPVHRILLGAGVILIENLELKRVPVGRYEMVALPLPIAGCEASPARVILRALPV